MFDISGKKVCRWYRETLSGFTDKVTQIELHAFDTVDINQIDRITGKIKTVFVPIFNPLHLGENMGVDDKNIHGEGYTIIYNKDTNKIFLLIMTRKAKIICDILSKLPLRIRLRVKTISKDMANNYDYIARTMFPHAKRIADKFHVLCLAFEALQTIRVRLRQMVLTEERVLGPTRKKIAKVAGLKFEKLQEKTYQNGETKKEILARGRHLLFKREKDWTANQEERSKILFALFPEIKKGYDIVDLFRDFYATKIGHRSEAVRLLKSWYTEAEGLHIEEVSNLVHSIERFEPDILNYFDEGHTNAALESLNAKIQRFVISTFGFQDRNLFHFRIKKHFS